MVLLPISSQVSQMILESTVIFLKFKKLLKIITLQGNKTKVVPKTKTIRYLLCYICELILALKNLKSQFRPEQLSRAKRTQSLVTSVEEEEEDVASPMVLSKKQLIAS